MAGTGGKQIQVLDHNRVYRPAGIEEFFPLTL
jgi:hypothetical protein